MLLEACCDSLDAAAAAQLGGADRIELCANLDVGGLTPHDAVLRHAVTRMTIPVLPMIRPRAGGFVYSADDTARLLADLHRARGLGVRGAVVGALTDQGDVDSDAIARCRDAAGPDIVLTFHRAFDATCDPFRSLEALIALGIGRVLTSGQHATAWDGRTLLRRLVDAAGDRIVIMAGGGVTPENAGQLVQSTGVRELHFRTNDASKVRRIRDAVAAHG